MQVEREEVMRDSNLKNMWDMEFQLEVKSENISKGAETVYGETIPPSSIQERVASADMMGEALAVSCDPERAAKLRICNGWRIRREWQG